MRQGPVMNEALQGEVFAEFTGMMILYCLFAGTGQHGQPGNPAHGARGSAGLA